MLRILHYLKADILVTKYFIFLYYLVKLVELSVAILIFSIIAVISVLCHSSLYLVGIVTAVVVSNLICILISSVIILREVAVIILRIIANVALIVVISVCCFLGAFTLVSIFCI